MPKPVIFRIVKKLGAGGIATRLRQLLPLLQEAFEVHVITYSEEGEFAPALRQAGIIVHHLPLSGKWSPSGLSGMARILRQHRAGLVHTHSFGGNISGILAAALAGVPVRVAQVHSRSQHWYGKTELRRKKQRLEEYCVHSLFTHKILFPSQSAREYFAAHCPVSRSKLHVLHNGVRLPDPPCAADAAAAAQIRARYNVPPERMLLGFVGRLSGGKGLEFALDFVQRARRAGKDCGLMVVGSVGGPDSTDRRLALGEAAGGVCFTGLQADAYPFYRCFDAFFFPSDSWTEALPGVVLEAAAHGLPILSRENPTVREIAGFYPAIRFMADGDDPARTLDGLLAMPAADSGAVAANFS
ncbi:MAG: glycosyltransferase family 4 protein, partial [Deltaproteobacteria bacterium]|nr:glycosyltransferase family 4 protein [Deltaproteobacteria bacterium]